MENIKIFLHKFFKSCLEIVILVSLSFHLQWISNRDNSFIKSQCLPLSNCLPTRQCSSFLVTLGLERKKAHTALLSVGGLSFRMYQEQCRGGYKNKWQVCSDSDHLHGTVLKTCSHSMCLLTLPLHHPTTEALS